MTIEMKKIAFPVILIPFLMSTSCFLQNKKGLDITTNGFINDKCYQALLVMEPETDATGLVEKRDSAYMKAKKTKIREIALDNLANYCIDMKLREYNINTNKKRIDMENIMSSVKEQLRKFISRGKIVFTYYDEKESFVIGYRIKKANLRTNIDTIITAIELNFND